MSDNDPVNLQELLDKPMGDFPDLPDLPGQKHFYGKITGVTAGKSTQRKTPLYNFAVRLTDPGSDVTPEDLAKIRETGFAISDYECSANFYLTPNAMKMLRRFLETMGFSLSVTTRVHMKLDKDGLPTMETQEVFRGRDVLIKTQAPADNGRVYLSNVDTIAGVSR